MIYLRKSDERGRGQYDWLQSYYSFSFANYYDPGFMGFGSLRVINEDVIQPSQGFGRHPHEDMEIITYVVEGALAHKDSMGNGSVILPGEIQRMSAGTGVEHSEYNHSKTDPLHLLQIWIIPDEEGLTPSYEQKKIDKKPNELILLGAPKEGLVTIHQDVSLYAGYFSPNQTLSYTIKEKRGLWIQLIKGALTINTDHSMLPGDGAAIFDQDEITLETKAESEFLIFDLRIVE